MNQLDSLNRIATLLSRFVSEVKAFNSINQFGINYLSETALIPLLEEIYDLNDLKNLNINKNIEGIDIGDQHAKVAFQITSTASNEKVKHTLRQFIQGKHYKKYKKLFIYIITEKQATYSDRGYAEILGDKISFTKEHILDYRDVLKQINGIVDYNKIKRIESLLEDQFTDEKLKTFKEQFEVPLYETVTTNLLEINFPQTLFVGKLSVNRNEVLKGMRNKKANDREIIFEFKRQNELRFSADWIDFQKQIVSFHDLSNTKHDLSRIVDQGTVERISSKEFYEISPDHLRAFKALLKFCFSKQAHFLGIDFIHDDNVYVFIPNDEKVITRTESWHSGKRNASREVVRVKEKNDKAWYYTNLAFSIAFKLFDDKWYVEINPDWYITNDGKQKNWRMNEEVVSYLKRKEKNQHVFNHLRFIGTFLKSPRNQLPLFESDMRRPANFLTFMKFATFKNSPQLFESNWITHEDPESLKAMQDKDGLLDLDI